MRNNPREELNNRLADLKGILNEVLELTRILEQTAEEFVRLGIDPATSDGLESLRHLIPELHEHYRTFESTLSTYQTDLLNHQLNWTAEDMEEVYTEVNRGITQLRQYSDQIATLAQNDRHAIVATRLAQLTELIFTLENTTQIARNQITQLNPNHFQFVELNPSITLLEQHCRECRHSIDLYMLIVEQVPFTLQNTIDLFEDLQDLVSVVSTSIEFAQTICMDLLNSQS